MEPGKCSILDTCSKVSMIERKDFGTDEQYTAAIENVCHKCDGPEETSPVEFKLTKTYKLLAYKINVGDEISLTEGELPLGIIYDSQSGMYAFILSPVIKVVPVTPKEEEKPEGEKDVDTDTTRPDRERTG